jgi:hypothetical protein
VSDPLAVPEVWPGRLAAYSQQRLAPGGNAVVAYLDVIAPDQLWPARWAAGLDGIGELMAQRRLPWTVEVGAVIVVFNSTLRHNLLADYAVLLQALFRMIPAGVAGAAVAR